MRKILWKTIKKNLTWMLLVSTLLLSILATITPRVLAGPTDVVVLPSLIEFPAEPDPTGTEFTITVEVHDVEYLYGVDIQLGWDTEWIGYVSHTAKIPVETYPDGILHEPGIWVRNDVDETGGLVDLGAEPGTLYWLAYASMYPAEPFDGSGIAFEMTFVVKKQPKEILGEPDAVITLKITDSTLADFTGTAIPHERYDGTVIIRTSKVLLPPGPVLKVMPEEVQGQGISKTFESDVHLLEVDPFWDVGGFDIVYNFDPTLIEAVSVTIDPDGWFAGFWPGGIFVIKEEIDNVAGTVWIAFLGIPSEEGTHTEVYGEGRLFTITFHEIFETTVYPPPSCALALNPTVIAGMPHPERLFPPYNGGDWAVPAPHTVEHGLYKSAIGPVGYFTYSPAMPVECETMVFDASQSYHSDPECWIVSYTWDFGDGSPIIEEEEPITTHFYIEAGKYNVTLVVTDNEGRTGSFSRITEISRFIGELKVRVDAGSVHFPYEKAEFYILVAHLGNAVDATDISATLYFNGAFYADLTPLMQQVDTGLYVIPYDIPPDAVGGRYELHVKVEYFNIHGTDIAGFQLSPTLMGWNALLINVNGTVGTIKTDVGLIQMRLDAINATLINIEGRIAAINSTIGLIQTDISTINMRLVDIQGTLGIINSTVGTFEVKLNSINATLTGLIVNAEGEILAKIDTALGTVTTKLDSINAAVTEVNGNTITINTSLGEVQATAGAIQSTATIGLALACILSLIAAIAALILIKKK